ncbi:hypothetical protein [Variovorax sp. KBW07]|uniref:hypothetical protein n=1 Tax=Variovorax sp. KBW07 TaxID=2153358 RepID=UPI001628B95F|nr:hypothetical protein [Variovorax sp. KBW07]
MNVASKDILDTREQLLRSAIAIREMAMRKRDKHPEASAEWDCLNDLAADADRQVFNAQVHQAEAQVCRSPWSTPLALRRHER